MSLDSSEAISSYNWNADLSHTLSESAKAFRRADNVEQQRKAVFDTLIHLIGLLREFPIAESELCALHCLAKALFDVSEGASTPPLLDPKRKAGRPEASADTRMLRCRAVMYVRLLSAQGLAVGKAEEEVALAVSRAGHDGHNGGTVNRDLVHQWCEQASPAGRSKEHATVVDLLHAFREKREDTLASIRFDMANDRVISLKGY